MKFKRDLKRVFYALFFFLFFSGTVWWAMEKWLRVHTALGEDHHPAQGIILRLHGLFSYFFITLFGYVIHSHIRPGLAAKKRKSYGTGMLFLVITVVLILSSAMDLYGPEGEVREFIIASHRFTGLAIPLILFAHLFNRRFHPPKPEHVHVHGQYVRVSEIPFASKNA